jgi:hypothetical protein
MQTRRFIHKALIYYLLKEKKDAFIFMADRWTPDNPIDGRYIWLPIQIKGGKPNLKWTREWM